MADELIETVRNSLEGQIDFKGQQLAEYLTYGILTFSGIVAYIAGYLTQNIVYTLWITLAGTALTFVVVVPPWPMFRKNPVAWLPPQAAYAEKGIEVDGNKVA